MDLVRRADRRLRATKWDVNPNSCGTMSTCRYPGDDLYLAAQSALDVWTCIMNGPVHRMRRAGDGRASPLPRTTHGALREGYLDIGRHLLAECLTLEAAVPRAIGMRRAYAAGLADLADDTRCTVADILEIYRGVAEHAPASDFVMNAPGGGAGSPTHSRSASMWTLGRAVVYSSLYPVEAWVERVRGFIGAAQQDEVWPHLSSCGFQETLFRSLQAQVDQVEHLHVAQVRHGIAEACLGDTLAATREELDRWLQILEETGTPVSPRPSSRERPVADREERGARHGPRSVPQRSAATLGRPGRQRPGADLSKMNVPRTEAPATDAPARNAPDTDAPDTDALGTDALGTDAPVTDPPGTDAPGTDAPDIVTPASDRSV